MPPRNMALPARKVAKHSVRKTSIGRLLDAEVPEVFVAQHSGHKNINSLNSYKAANSSKRYQMSNILSSVNDNTSSTSQVQEARNSVVEQSQVHHSNKIFSSSDGSSKLHVFWCNIFKLQF